MCSFKEFYMKKVKQIYEGKAKKLYETDDKDLYIQEFKDDATAFDATKRGALLKTKELSIIESPPNYLSFWKKIK